MEIPKEFLQSVTAAKTLYAIPIIPYKLGGQPTTQCTALLPP